MIRSQLVQKIADDNAELSRKDAERVVDTVFEEIIRALSSGRRVELRGFGVFLAKQRDGRIGRNPRTGESVSVEPKAVPVFKMGKSLYASINAEIKG